MKALSLILLLFCTFSLAAQPENDDGIRLNEYSAVSHSRYLVGGFYGTFVGFGTGKFIQQDTFGIFYLLTELACAAAFLADHDPNLQGFFGGLFIGLRLIEIGDTWIIPNEPPMKLTGRAPGGPQFNIAFRF